MILGMFLSTIGLASATTIIVGTIYNEDYTHKIGDAEITVACTHDSQINYRYTTSASSGTEIGDYWVSYPETGNDGCSGGDSVTVTATKGDLFGTETETVVEDTLTGLDVAIINVPMTPEFGIVVGSLTLFASIGIFFLLKREN